MFRNSSYVLVMSLAAGLMFVAAAACVSELKPSPTPTPTAEPTLTAEPTPTRPAQPTTKMDAKQYSAPPSMSIDRAKKYTAVIEMGDGGEIVIELAAIDAPKTVNNFVFLAREGYYDGMTFHRVIPGFMAQSGDPSGTGSGSPGYNIEDEFSPNLRHDGAGVLSMANTGRPNSGGGQFFILYAPTPHLDDAHSVFGKVIEGMDVVDGLTPRDPAAATTLGDAVRTIRIEEAP